MPDVLASTFSTALAKFLDTFWAAWAGGRFVSRLFDMIFSLVGYWYYKSIGLELFSKQGPHFLVAPPKNTEIYNPTGGDRKKNDKR
jgi:hypothetical protein